MTAILITLLLILCYISITDSLRIPNLVRKSSYALQQQKVYSPTRNSMALAADNKKWSKSELEGEDYFDEELEELENSGKKKKEKMKQKFKLDPEITFFEGPPSPTEILFPALSILTVIGIVPFISAVSRQFWVKYKFTSRRIAINSGIGGKIRTEVIYPDIEQIKFVYRAFGAAGDMVLFLKDGAKVELRHVPNFNDIYTYVLSKCDDECKEKSMKITVPSTNTSQ